MPGSRRLQLDTWGCDASPEANPAPCRQQVYATNVGQRVSVLVYTYCLSLCTCGGNRHGRVVAAPAIWTHPKLPSRIQTNTVLMRDRPPCPDSECRRAAAQVVPISCGYCFRATQILRIKNQVWHRGRRQTCGDSAPSSPCLWQTETAASAWNNLVIPAGSNRGYGTARTMFYFLHVGLSTRA